MAGRSVHRRDLLRGAAAVGLATGFTSLWAPRSARASDLSLADRIDHLYSNRFHFDRSGEPQITVGLMQAQTEVVLEAPGGLRVLPSGDGGTAIEGSRRWRIRLLRGEASEQRFSVVLEAFAATDGKSIAKAARAWKKKGHDPHEREVGALFGVQGRALDARKVLLTTGDHSSERDAARAARVLSQRKGALGKLHPVVQKRASGVMIAEDLERGTIVRAEGVLWFEPIGKGPMTVEDVLHGTTMGDGSRETRAYRGQIYVAIDRHGKLSVVNRVSETDLLSGLVPAEIFASAPMAALQAQAVAARGILLSKVGNRHLDDPFLLCSEQHCQVYAGKHREHPRTTSAVHKTRGRVLMRPGGTQLVDTVYSANSGGHTEDNDLVWPSPRDPQLRGRPDPLVARRYPGGIDDTNLRAWLEDAARTYSRPESQRLRDSYRWEAFVDPASIAGKGTVPEALGTVRQLDVLERGRSGRAIRLRVTGERGQVDVHGELTIRRALGNLRSSMFMVMPHTDRFGRFHLVGGGHGHGVGLCQHGAIGMAAAGKAYTAILGHYYHGTRPTKLW